MNLQTATQCDYSLITTTVLLIENWTIRGGQTLTQNTKQVMLAPWVKDDLRANFTLVKTTYFSLPNLGKGTIKKSSSFYY